MLVIGVFAFVGVIVCGLAVGIALGTRLRTVRRQTFGVGSDD